MSSRLFISCVPLLRQNSRQINLSRRTFTLVRNPRNLRKSDVIENFQVGDKWKRFAHHGKGGTTQEIFILFRWSKQVWQKMFGKYLLITNILGSGALMVVGDVVAQEIEYRHGLREERHDIGRMLRMFVAGALMGPLHHYVYNWMDKAMPKRTFSTIANKILIDQLFMSPACIIIFFYTLCSLEGHSLQETNNELIAKFPYVYLLDWIFWPAAQYANFRYLDTKYRVGFVNILTAAYNVLLSYMKHDFGLELPELESVPSKCTTPGTS